MRHAPLFALIAAVLLLPAAASAADEPQRRTLTLTGTGEVTAAPDLATVDIGVVSDADTARAALDANTEAMARVMRSFAELGIDDKDLQTQGFNVEPRYHYDPKNEQPPRLVGYRVSNTVHVKVRDLGGLGGVLDTVVTEGSNEIRGLAFGFADPDSLLDEARRLAGADARRKAGIYAEGLGVRLGRIVEVSEAGNVPRPMPVMMRAAAMEARDVPVAAGEQSVSASVNVTWEIR